MRGDSSVNDLLTLSQVVLALQLPLAMFPLLHFTSSRRRMGRWRNGWFLLVAGWASAILITALDIYGLPDAVKSGMAGGHRRLNPRRRIAMYKNILVTLDGTPTDRAIIEHVKALAAADAQPVVLLHVADGWAARMFGPDAVSPEINEDKAYLEKVRSEFQSAGISATAELAYGEPGDEIVKWVERKGCDLVAMSMHGHRFLADLLLGSTVRRVRHNILVPLLLLRAR